MKLILMLSSIINFIPPPNEYGCVYAWTTLGNGPTIVLQKMSILAKKIIFSAEVHYDLGGCGYVNKQNCRTHTLNSRRTQNESLFGADFGPEA